MSSPAGSANTEKTQPENTDGMPDQAQQEPISATFRVNAGHYPAKRLDSANESQASRAKINGLAGEMGFYDGI